MQQINPAEFVISSMPCANYAPYSRVELLGEQAKLFTTLTNYPKGSKLFFFHGIFLKESTRVSTGVSAEAFKAKLVDFERHNDYGHSDVRYCPGIDAKGVIAIVPPRALPRLDQIEGTPTYYRREEVPLYFKDGTTSHTVQYYVMNEDLPDNKRTELYDADLGYTHR